MFLDLLPAGPGARNGKLYLDIGELAELLDDFLNLPSQFARRGKANCLGDELDP